jgi:prepilin-type N-terminal cleavage/methylation domain-containing protein
MKHRQGFTLVELLVSMALIIFIMAILSQAFVAALTTFRNLKAEGDMAEKLRAVTQLLQRDLAADHFEGKKRLSNPNFWQDGPPQQGFFQIYHGSASSLTGPNNFIEGYDLDSVPPIYPLGIGSYRSTDHALSFTVKLRGNQMGDFFSASGGMAALSGLFGPSEARYQTATSGGSYNYQWAAVAWFLQPQINPTTGTQDTTIQSIPLYTLYRRQALLVPDNSLVPTQSYTAPNILTNPTSYDNLIANFLEMSCWGDPLSTPPGSTPGSFYFNGPIDITAPTRRFWGGQGPYQPIPQASPLYGSDIQLNDVVSFDSDNGQTNIDPFVTLWQFPFNTLNTANPPGLLNGNPAYYVPITNPAGPMVFDTWSRINDSLGNFSQWNVGSTQQAPNTAAIPLWNGTSGPIIQAIQITIRIWDSKTNQTRQVTMVQAM